MTKLSVKEIKELAAKYPYAVKEKGGRKIYILPPGLVVNASLFQMRSYTDAAGNESKPSYSIRCFYHEAALPTAFIKAVDAEAAAYAKELRRTVATYYRRIVNDNTQGAVMNPEMYDDGFRLSIGAKNTFGLNKNNIRNLIGADEPEAFYPGMWGCMVVSLGRFNNTQHNAAGIRMQLLGFFKVEDGEPLSGAPDLSAFIPEKVVEEASSDPWANIN